MKRPACAACKHQRRRCTQDCFLAPFFPAEKSKDFEAVHKHFGLHNVVYFLKALTPEQRPEAITSMVYESHARLRDPVSGCSGIISMLLQRVNTLQAELAHAENEVAYYRALKQQQIGEQNIADNAGFVDFLQENNNATMLADNAGFVDFLQENNNATMLQSLNQDLNILHENLENPQQPQESSFAQETTLFGSDPQGNSLSIAQPFQLTLQKHQETGFVHSGSVTNLSIGDSKISIGGRQGTSLTSALPIKRPLETGFVQGNVFGGEGFNPKRGKSDVKPKWEKSSSSSSKGYWKQHFDNLD